MHLKGYEDLDKIPHNQTPVPAHNNKSNINPGEQQITSSSLVPPFRRLLSMSDPNIYTNSSNRSGLSINTRVSLGSICLLRPANSYYNNADDVQLMAASPVQIFKKYRRERTLLLTFVLFYICFLMIGAISFQIIETPVEMQEKNEIAILRNNFLMKYPEVKDDDLEEFLKAVITANDRGISPLRNATNEMNWSFGQALFFSSTVVTTIGYGHVTPLSQTGKIFCMIYAAIGIPLTLVLLSAMVEKLLIPANWLLGLLNSKLGHLYQPFNIRVMHLTIVVIIVAILFFAIPTAVFAYLEPSWGILDAFYYCFISLTTIGLGDYIPGDGVSIDNRSIYKMIITAYLVFGLIAMMLVLTIFYDIPQLNLGQLFTESTNGETEKLRLSGNNTTCYSGPTGLYMPQRNEDTRRAIVRIRPHGDDSPSPDEAPSSSSQSRDLRMP